VVIIDDAKLIKGASPTRGSANTFKSFGLDGLNVCGVGSSERERLINVSEERRT